LFTVGNGAVNALQFMGNCAVMTAKTPHFSYPYSVMNFMDALTIRIVIAEMAGNL
jgi:hypothetical protein